MPTFSSKNSERKWREIMQEFMLELRINTEKLLKEFKK